MAKKRIREMPIQDLVDLLRKDGYIWDWIHEGEAVFVTPKDDVYQTSVTGVQLKYGCTCIGGEYGVCKHMRVVAGTRVCDALGCGGEMLHVDDDEVFKCTNCNKTTSWEVVSNMRSPIKDSIPDGDDIVQGEDLPF